jgi:hypothetical protein
MAVGEGGGDSAPGPIVMKSRRCECVVLEKKAEGRFFFFTKITCTEGGVRESLIAKVTPTLRM